MNEYNNDSGAPIYDYRLFTYNNRTSFSKFTDGKDTNKYAIEFRNDKLRYHSYQETYRSLRNIGRYASYTSYARDLQSDTRFPKDPSYADRKTLVFDLDETLVHSFDPSSSPPRA